MPRRRLFGLSAALVALLAVSQLGFRAAAFLRQRSLDAALLETTATGAGFRVPALLAQGADPNVRDPDPRHGGTTPLLNAVRMLETDAARALLAHGADPNAADSGGWTPLMWAVAAGDGNHGTVSALLRAGADPGRISPANGESTLQIARRFHHPESALLLVRAGARR